MKSGHYFYKMALLETAPVWQSSQFFPAKDATHGFVITLQNGIFLFLSSTEIFIDVEHYLENNISFILHDFPNKLWNPNSTFTKTTHLQTVPVWQS